MFDSLNKRLADVFQKLRRKGSISEQDIDEAMREIRIALLEADVALPVVRDFIARVKDKALGAEVVGSLSPGQALRSTAVLQVLMNVVLFIPWGALSRRLFDEDSRRRGPAR